MGYLETHFGTILRTKESKEVCIKASFLTDDLLEKRLLANSTEYTREPYSYFDEFFSVTVKFHTKELQPLEGTLEHKYQLGEFGHTLGQLSRNNGSNPLRLHNFPSK